MPVHITSIRFSNYKAFRQYSVTLGGFNILVGPNNAGKSTVIGALRVLAEGLRRARARKPEYVDASAIRAFAYPVSLKDIPVSTENVFTNYDDSQPAVVQFYLSNGNKLKLIFPESDSCFMVCETGKRVPRSPQEFIREFDISISFVPVLGPVEHDEQLYQKEAARRALLTHRASRNFRNIWYHYPEEFEGFRAAIQSTWPGMDIQMPEINRDGDASRLYMFCPEERYPRELFWAGFGFQVWCQMLTFITKAERGSLLVVDEPDIYLHSDLQRQLLHLLRAREGDVLIATHSTEMLSEAEAGEIVVLNKKWKSAKRIDDSSQIQGVFGALGSSLNPTLTQLARTRKVIFVEGDDFSLIGAFARKLGKNALANRSAFAVVPARGFNPARVRDFSEGIQMTLGVEVSKAVIFDRDYRSDTTLRRLEDEFYQECDAVKILERKEIENYLLIASVIERSINARIQDRRARGGDSPDFSHDVTQVLENIATGIKSEIFGHFSASYLSEFRSENSGLDMATLTKNAHIEFEKRWGCVDSRLALLPGKTILARLNDFLQTNYKITLTTTSILSSMRPDDVPLEMKELVDRLERFVSAHNR